MNTAPGNRNFLSDLTIVFARLNYELMTMTPVHMYSFNISYSKEVKYYARD